MVIETGEFIQRTYGEKGSATTPSPHAVIRASAGSGKTYQLTNRYLRLLRAGAVPPTILATTFTRKAAGEILQRVLGRLAKACEDDAARTGLASDLGGYPLSAADCLAMLRRVVATLHKLSIGTIDSFFNQAAGALRYELGLPAEPRLTDEGSPLSKQLRLDAIQAVLGDAAATDEGFQTLIELLRRLHHDTAQRRVTDAIDGIATSLYDVYRQYPEETLWGNMTVGKPLPREQVAGLVGLLESLAEELPTTKAGKPRMNWVKAYHALLQAMRAGDHKAILDLTLMKNLRTDGNPEASGKYDGVEIDGEWFTLLKACKLHATAVAVHELIDQTHATYNLLRAFDEQYTRLRREHRVLLFSDLTHLLARYAPDDNDAFLSELYYRLDAQVTHLLLDEFQDTSLDQWAVLRGFAQEVAAVGDGQRSLFCVGDVKQAIYGWRGGCAELFERVEQLPGLSSDSLSSLTKSYRSSQVVLDAVNTVFDSLDTNLALADVTDDVAAWGAYFDTHEAAKKGLPGHVVLRSTRPKDDGDAIDEPGDDEDGAADVGGDPHWRYVAEYVRDLHRSAPGRSVGVLLRRRKSAAPLLHELRLLGVEVSEEGGNPIDNAPAVAAVLSAIRLADHPGDQAAAFHVANSPLGPVLGLTSQRGPTVADVAQTLRRAMIDRGYSGVIADWTRALAPSCDARSLRRLTQLVALAEGYDPDAGLRPGGFVDTARAARVEDPSAAPVRVMTVHAAKGLEFDCVVLPELSQTLSANDHRELVLLDRDGPADPPRSILRRPDKAMQAMLIEWGDAAKRRAGEQRREDLCLLYVAMTRPRHALHLLVPPPKLLKSGKRSDAGITNLSYAAILRQAFHVSAENDPSEGDAVLYEAGDAAWAGSDGAAAPITAATAMETEVLNITLAKPGSAGPARSWAEASPSALHGGGEVDALDLLGLSEIGGRSYGTAVHALYERVGFADEDPPPGRAGLIERMRTIDGSLDAGALVDQFLAQLKAPAIRAALSRNGAAEFWRERSFLAPVDGRLLKGTFDRVTIWRDDQGNATRAKLVDFKTDRVDDATLPAKVEHYRGQIEAYRGALGAMLGLGDKQIEAELAFVGDRMVVEV